MHNFKMFVFKGKQYLSTLSSLVIGEQACVSAAETAGVTVTRKRWKRKQIKRTIDLSVILETWQLRVGTWAWQRSEKKNIRFFFYSNCKYSISINYSTYYFWHIKPKKSNGTWTVSQMWRRGGTDIRDTFYYLLSSAAHCSSPLLCCAVWAAWAWSTSARWDKGVSSLRHRNTRAWDEMISITPLPII